MPPLCGNCNQNLLRVRADRLKSALTVRKVVGMLVPCRVCKAEIAKGAQTCPKCGAGLPTESDLGRYAIGAFLLLAMVVVGLLVVIALAGN
jgi:predicted nucleic acid-binding Zn ribbon protein